MAKEQQHHRKEKKKPKAKVKGYKNRQIETDVEVNTVESILGGKRDYRPLKRR